MIAGLSRFITTLLAPILALTSFLLILFAYLSPTLMLATQVSLLTVRPSTALTSPGSSNSSVDGPTVFLGALGRLRAVHFVVSVVINHSSYTRLLRTAQRRDYSELHCSDGLAFLWCVNIVCSTRVYD